MFHNPLHYPVDLRDVASFFLLSLSFVEFRIQEDATFPCGYSLLPPSVSYNGSSEDVNRCSAKNVYCFTLVWEALAYMT